MPQTITCTITNPAGAVIPELNVRAYALQPGRETLLAQGLSNDKGICRLEYEWAGGKVLHVQVRAFSFAGVQLGASEVVYNAKPQEQIRFKVKPPAPPKEYEGIQAVLRHILPEGQTLAANEGALVVKSLGEYNGVIPKAYRAMVTEARVENLLHSRALAEASGLPEAICFAIGRVSRKKWTAQTLLAEADTRLNEWVNKAVAENIIAEPEDPILPLFDGARYALGLITWQESFGTLRSKTTGQPLADYTVRLRDVDNDRDLGYDTSNSLGRFAMRFTNGAQKAGDGAQTGRQLELTVFAPGGEKAHQEIIRLQPGQEEYGDIQVSEPAVLANRVFTSKPPETPTVPSFLMKYRSDSTSSAALRTMGAAVDIQTWKEVTSPRSYLADLLSYAVKYLRMTSGGNPAPVPAADLSALLHQPFNELLLSVSHVEQPVRQIRLCIEALRRLLGHRPLSDNAKEAALATAEASWRTTSYDSLLVQLGVSVEAMSKLTDADEETRKFLAARLGVNPDKLADFYQPEASLTEAWLEQTFGLADTARDGLSTGVKLGDAKNQLIRWQLDGLRWNETTDADGKAHLRLSNPAANSYLVEVFKDAARSSLLASGSIATAQGTVTLNSFASSGVQGFFELNYDSGGSAIFIAVIPALLACRYQLARQRWQEQYQPDDPEGLQFLTEMHQNAQSTLEKAIEKTETLGLPALRDALAAATGQNLRRLSERLLVDCEFNAAFFTTRTTQAITALQQLLGGLRSGLLQDTFPNLQLQASDYDEEWNWLGTYDNWRSAILVFLYPENMLDPTLRRWQTPAFKTIVENLRADRQLTDEGVIDSVEKYERFFKDICQMEIETTCQTITEFDWNTNPVSKNIFYQFGRASHGVYWATFDLSANASEKQSYWSRVPGFEDFLTTQLLGAVPYKTNENKRYIYLFARGYSKSKYTNLSTPDEQMFSGDNWSLVYTAFDLQTQEWNGKLIYLSKPGGPATIVVEQRLSEQHPPHLVIQTQSGILSRFFNLEGTDWASETTWKNIHSGKDILEFHAFFRIGTKFHLLAKTKEEFSDGFLRLYNFSSSEIYLNTTNIVIADFTGATLHSSSLLYYFYSRSGATYYRPIKFSSTKIEVTSERPAPVGFSGVASHNGTSEESVQLGQLPGKGFRLIYKNTSGQQGYYQAFFIPNTDNLLERYFPLQVLPEMVTFFNLKPQNQLEWHQRRQRIEYAFQQNSAAPSSVLNYLWEAYCFLPQYLAQQLLRSRRHTEALDYFRLVYDYSLPMEDRKIFYGLKQEENLPLSYERPADWLLDPLNPHNIAAGRRQVYTRYTLLALTRSFLQAGDAEFTRDTAESLATARAFYDMALEQLESPEFQHEQATWGLLFTVPRNPVVDTLRFYAELNLHKLHTGRNIAGDEREAPLLESEAINVGELTGINGYQAAIIPAANVQRPTPYRFAVLIERAKQLAGMAQQMEAAFLSVLEKLDAEQLQLLHAKNELQTAKATIRLQDLRVKEARDGVKLAELQLQRSYIQRDHFKELLQEGLNELEIAALIAEGAAIVFLVASVAHDAYKAGFTFGLLGDPASKAASAAQALASFLQTKASYERREQDWRFQLSLTQQEIKISNQQIRISQDQVQIVSQERNIAALRSDQAASVANFLSTKFTSTELYDFMSDVLEGVYSFFLQQATATAQLAALQLAFERQEPVPAVVLADYWAPPSRDNNGSNENSDRRGLTGSARLLQDIHRLDQIAFQTDQRKLQLSKTVSLAQLSPAEFQRFRETGVFPFLLPMEVFDRDFPGHYLRLIRQARVSVIALIPPMDGIRATLTNNGISRVVLPENGWFRETVIRRPPESIAFTSPFNANGLFEMQPDAGKLLPFESMGVDGFWELQLPKAANPSLDYSTIADVLLTIEYTALQSPTYREQVIRQLDRTFSADRPFSFRNQFADQWYDLNNPEETASPMVVRFKTDRKDFPPNVDQLKIQQVVLYFSRADGETKEIEANLSFIEQGKTDEDKVGGAATTSDGIISTRRSNASSWTAMLGKPPIGEWVLSFDEELSGRFKNNKIEDILFVITFQGETPEWPKLPA